MAFSARIGRLRSIIRQSMEGGAAPAPGRVQKTRGVLEVLPAQAGARRRRDEAFSLADFAYRQLTFGPAEPPSACHVGYRDMLERACRALKAEADKQQNPADKQVFQEACAVLLEERETLHISDLYRGILRQG